ncbi:MAG: hypothetical protein H7301_00465 [Cryobacterium sp.]|nr:hypothetical protein [Oligoflexia bacterium]
MSAAKFCSYLAFVLFCTLLATGCTQKVGDANDPKQRLTDYISTSFSVHTTADRLKLQNYLTGGAKNRLVSWSDEQFRQAFVDSKREFVKLAIRDVKAVNDNRTDLTYELTYLDQGRGPDARVTTKRMCEMSLENGKWFIREVKNIKELIEYKNEISIVY